MLRSKDSAMEMIRAAGLDGLSDDDVDMIIRQLDSIEQTVKKIPRWPQEQTEPAQIFVVPLQTCPS